MIRRANVNFRAHGDKHCEQECNLKHLAELVRREVPDGVGLVLSDGGFPDARNRHDQALAMRQLVLGQMTAMAMVLREGGTWVCKVR